GTFDLGGEVQTTVPAATVSRLKVKITVGSTQRRRLVLPRVTHIGTSKNEVQGWRVSGVVTNPYEKPIDGYAGTACAVVFDTRGSVLGGLYEVLAEATQTS